MYKGNTRAVEEVIRSRGRERRVREVWFQPGRSGKYHLELDNWGGRGGRELAQVEDQGSGRKREDVHGTEQLLSHEGFKHGRKGLLVEIPGG